MDKKVLGISAAAFCIVCLGTMLAYIAAKFSEEAVYNGLGIDYYKNNLYAEENELISKCSDAEAQLKDYFFCRQQLTSNSFDLYSTQCQSKANSTEPVKFDKECINVKEADKYCKNLANIFGISMGCTVGLVIVCCLLILGKIFFNLLRQAPVLNNNNNLNNNFETPGLAGGIGL